MVCTMVMSLRETENQKESRRELLQIHSKKKLTINPNVKWNWNNVLLKEANLQIIHIDPRSQNISSHLKMNYSKKKLKVYV